MRTPTPTDLAVLGRAVVRVEESARSLEAAGLDQADRLRGLAGAARSLVDFVAELSHTLEVLAVEAERAAAVADQGATLARSTASLAGSAGWLAGPAEDAGGDA